jgi:peptidyl-prolyl cis-trans isomerase B (cyclophilin B)
MTQTKSVFSVLPAIALVAAAVLAGCAESGPPEPIKVAEPSQPTQPGEPKTQEKSMPEPLPQVTLQTDKGNIVLELAEDDAPNTVANFISLADKGFYDGLKFHRVIANFMIQGGCPLGSGTGGPGYVIADEFSPRQRHTRGVISMANAGPNTGGSQFFITHVPCPHLDGKHAVFGRITAGLDVLDAIQKGDRIVKVTVDRKRNHPYKPVVAAER